MPFIRIVTFLIGIESLPYWSIEMQLESRNSVSSKNGWVVRSSFLKHILLRAADWQATFFFLS